MSAWVRLTTRIYRRLVRWFPHEFQMRHGEELEQMGGDSAAFVAERYGALGLLRLLLDAVARLVAEHLTELARDVKYSARRLRSSPGFVTVGVLSLALAIGLCCIIYTQTAIMTRPVQGVADGRNLLAIETLVSYPYLEQYRQDTDTVAEAAAFIGPTPFIVRVEKGQGERQRIFGHLVTPNYFSVIGVRAEAGRLFNPSIEKPGSKFTVVVSHKFWR